MSTSSFFDSILHQGIGPLFIRSDNPTLYPTVLIALAFALVITLRIVFVDISRYRSRRSRDFAVLRTELFWDALILLSQWGLIWVIWEAFTIPYDTLPFWRVPAPDSMLGPVGLHGLYYFLAVLLHILVSLFALQALGGIWLPELLPSAFGSDRISALAGVIFSGAAIYGWEMMRWPDNFTIPSEIFLIFSFSVMLMRIVAPGEPSSDAMARTQYIAVALLDLLGIAAVWQFHHLDLPSDIAGLITQTANPTLYPYALAAVGISLIAALVNGALAPLEPIKRQNAMQSTMGGALVVWVSQLVLLWVAWWGATSQMTKLPLVNLSPSASIGPWPLLPVFTVVAILIHGAAFTLGLSNMVSIWVNSLLRLPTSGAIGGLFSTLLYSLATYALYRLGWPSWVTAILEIVVLLVILGNIDEWLESLNRLGASTLEALRRLKRIKSAIESAVTFLGIAFITLTNSTSIYLLEFFALFFMFSLLDRVVKDFVSIVNPRKSEEDVGLLSPRRWYFTTLIVLALSLLGAAGAFRALSPANAPSYAPWLEVGAAAIAYMIFKPLITFANESAAKHEDPIRAQNDRLERIFMSVQAASMVADAPSRMRNITLPGSLNNLTIPGISLTAPGLTSVLPTGASSEPTDKHSHAAEIDRRRKTIRRRLDVYPWWLFLGLGLVYHFLTTYLHLTTLLSTSSVPLVFGLVALAASMLQVIERSEMSAPRYVALLLVFIVILMSGVTMLFTLAHISTAFDPPNLLANPDVLAVLSNESFLSLSMFTLVRELLVLITIGQLYYLFRLIEASLAVDSHSAAQTASADDNALELVEHGEWLVKQNEAEQGCGQFRKALNITDTSDGVIRRAGLNLQRRGKFAEALTAYERAIAIEPTSAVYWNDKGVALAALDRFPEAINAYNQATKLNTEYALAWDNKGDAFLRSGSFAQALTAYQKAVELAQRNRDNKDVYLNNVCSSLLMLRRYQEALDSINQALSIDSKWALAWRNKADALLNLPNRSSDALQAAERALSLQSHSIRGWTLYGQALAAVGRIGEARKAFERALTFDAEKMDSWGSHGEALIGLGRHDEALKALDRAIRLDPKDPDNWRSKAIALRALGRAREAFDAERHEKQLIMGNAVAS